MLAWFKKSVVEKRATGFAATILIPNCKNYLWNILTVKTEVGFCGGGYGLVELVFNLL
jgi:hypothetical protein